MPYWSQILLSIPISAVLQMDNPRRQLTGSTLTARLKSAIKAGQASALKSGEASDLSTGSTVSKRSRALASPGKGPAPVPIND
jgi:hypothetical protein